MYIIFPLLLKLNFYPGSPTSPISSLVKYLYISCVTVFCKVFLKPTSPIRGFQIPSA